jgi:hypothetical protein
MVHWLGTPAHKTRANNKRKYFASYGVAIEPWTDFRRTGYPALTLPSNAVVPYFPRSLFYPQSEIDLNPENAKQKSLYLHESFWDTRL